MSAFCLEVNLVLYVPRDRDSAADAEIDAESGAESDAEADVKANMNADLEADAEAGLGSIGVVELVWPVRLCLSTPLFLLPQPRGVFIFCSIRFIHGVY